MSLIEYIKPYRTRIINKSKIHQFKIMEHIRHKNGHRGEKKKKYQKKDFTKVMKLGIIDKQSGDGLGRNIEN